MDMDGTWLRVKPYEDRYRYNHKELTKGLGWYAYGARYYDAAIGRFAGVDPIGDKFPHVSTFNYAENTPINAIDLHGLQAFFIHGQASSNRNWDSPSFSKVLNTLKEYTNNRTIDKKFSWGKNAPLYNVRNKSDQIESAYNLSRYVMENRVEGEEVSLIGVSNGGNIGIMAAAILYHDFGIKVNIITVNTPAQTSKYQLDNPNRNKGINDMIQIVTEDDIIPGYAGPTYDWEYNEYPKTHTRRELVIRNQYDNPIKKHSTSSVNVEQIFNSYLTKLKPVPEEYNGKNNK